jgi:D-alanine transaminase
MGIAVEERAFTLEEMMGADEVLITSASALCVRVSEVDGRAVGGRDAERVKRLQDALMEDFLKNTEG